MATSYKYRKGEVQTEVTRGEYKGHPLVVLPNGSWKGFSFGYKKALTILDYVDDIREFVRDCEAV